MNHPPPRISLCMIVRDEEDWLVQCLESVSAIVSETIIVDTGSRDRTAAIAHEHGAQVYHRPWDDDFAAPRNLGLERAKGDWILVLDADEAIDSEDLRRLTALTTNPDGCYELVQRHYTDDHRLSDFTPVRGEFPRWERKHGGYFESKLVRFFPNHRGIRYVGRIHELVEPSIYTIPGLQIINSQIRLHHYGHTEAVRQKKNKAKIYTPLGQAKLSEEPRNWKAYFELGVEHNCNGRYEESAVAFAKAAELNPSYITTWSNFGYVLCELGRYAEAEQALKRALQLDPKCSESFCNLGVVYLRTQKLSLAERCFARAFEIDPKYVNALCNLAKALAFQQRNSEAANCYLRALDLMPNCQAAKMDLGILYLQAGMHSQAVKYLGQIAPQLSDDHPLLYHLGELYRMMDDTTRAIATLSRFAGAGGKGGKISLEQQALFEAARIECALLEATNVEAMHCAPEFSEPASPPEP